MKNKCEKCGQEGNWLDPLCNSCLLEKCLEIDPNCKPELRRGIFKAEALEMWPIPDLECQCEKLNAKVINGKFYYEGKYFDKEEDFWKYIKEWSFLPLDAETANRHLDTIKKDILMNIYLKDIEMNNGEFKEFLNCVFEFAMKELYIYEERESVKSFKKNVE